MPDLRGNRPVSLRQRGGPLALDLLSGFGVFAIGRNHPHVREVLTSVLDSDLPNLVQLDVSTLAGVSLAERLLKYTPIWTGSSSPIQSAESVEAAIKFAGGHRAPGDRVLRSRLSSWGLSPTARSSINGDATFRRAIRN